MHAGEIALERFAPPDLETLSSIILGKRNASAVERSRGLGPFLRMQLQAFPFDADRRRNDVPAVADGAGAGNLVVNVLAARIDVLRTDSAGNQQRLAPDRGPCHGNPDASPPWHR